MTDNVAAEKTLSPRTTMTGAYDAERGIRDLLSSLSRTPDSAPRNVAE